MDSVIGAAKELVRYLLGSPQTFQNHAILGTLAILSALFIFGRMCNLMNVGRSGAGAVVATLLVGFVLMLAVLVIADVFVIPRVLAKHRTVGLGIATVVASLVVVAPMVCKVQHTSYGAAVFSWLTSVLVAVFIVIIARAGMDLFVSGGKQGEKVKARSVEMQDFLNSN